MSFIRRVTSSVAIAVALSVLGIVTIAAGYVPARQASRIDPVRALRAD